MVGFALWFITFLFVLQAIVLLYLLTAKKRRLDSEEDIETYYKKWFFPFFSYLTGEVNSVPHFDGPAGLRLPVIERVLNYVIDNHEDYIDDEKLRDVANLYLTPSYRLFLKKGSWSQRVNTLYFIEKFKIYELKNDVWTHFHHTQNVDEEYRQALRTLASFHDERLIPVLLETHGLSQRMIKELLRRLPTSLIHQLVEAIENEKKRLPHQLQLGIVSFCGELGAEEFLPFIEKRLSYPNKEIRLKALRAVADIGNYHNFERLHRFFSSDNWEERMLVAKVAGNLQLTVYREELHTLAGDRAWWVRYAALEALRQLPEGPRLLEEVLVSHKDKYARDMASRLLTMEGSRS